VNHRSLYFRDKINLAIVLAFILIFFLDFIVNIYVILPSESLPKTIVDLINTDTSLPDEAKSYALSDFIIVKKVTGTVRVIWGAPEELSSPEYLRLNIVFYLVSFIVIPMLIANINVHKVLKDNIVEYVKSVIIPMLLAGIFNVNRLFGSIGFYFARIVFTKLDMVPQKEYTNTLATYFLSQYSEKWVILLGFIALSTFFILKNVRRDTILGMLSEALNFVLLGTFYYASYILIIHLLIVRETLFNYLILFPVMLLPVVRIFMIIKLFESV